MLDGKWDQDANNANRRDDVIKQIRKVMDEVSHHALKQEMMVTGCSRKANTHMRWGAGL